MFVALFVSGVGDTGPELLMLLRMKLRMLLEGDWSLVHPRNMLEVFEQKGALSIACVSCG